MSDRHMHRRGSVSSSITEEQAYFPSSQESQESQESQRSALILTTGMSQDFTELDVSTDAPLSRPTNILADASTAPLAILPAVPAPASAATAAPADEVVQMEVPAGAVTRSRSRSRTRAQESSADFSIGTVCVIYRPSSNRKQKVIKKFALQKTFYAYPRNATTEQKNKIETRIQNDMADFVLQGYEIQTHTFDLPFEVEEICCVSRGYNLLPKILKAPRVPATVGAKRKTHTSSSSSTESEGSIDEIDVDDDEDTRRPSRPLTRTPIVAKRTRK